jgi:SAM-dependent methyltransferase
MAVIWLKSRKELHDLQPVLDASRKTIEPFLLSQGRIQGFCCACKSLSEFKVPSITLSGDWVNLLEGIMCDCGLNGRMRLILRILDELLVENSYKSPIVFEKLTPLFPYIKKRMPSITGVEFFGDTFPPGELVDTKNGTVQNESLMRLSFGDSSTDLIMHFDVIEHVPDMKQAFTEIYRCLTPGGKMFFTCPFYHQLEKNIIRAAIVEDKLVHYLDPCFHGNPISGDGSLVFQHPSWEIVEMMQDSGFIDIRFPLLYSPLEGIVSNSCPYENGHTWPMGVVASKPLFK